MSNLEHLLNKNIKCVDYYYGDISTTQNNITHNYL